MGSGVSTQAGRRAFGSFFNQDRNTGPPSLISKLEIQKKQNNAYCFITDVKLFIWPLHGIAFLKPGLLWILEHIWTQWFQTWGCGSAFLYSNDCIGIVLYTSPACTCATRLSSTGCLWVCPPPLWALHLAFLTTLSVSSLPLASLFPSPHTLSSPANCVCLRHSQPYLSA